MSLTAKELGELIVSFLEKSKENPDKVKIITDIFSTSIESSFKKIATPKILWIHVNNENTKCCVNYFKKIAGNVNVVEIHSLERLREFIAGVSAIDYQAIITEMGFWRDKKHVIFDKNGAP